MTLENRVRVQQCIDGLGPKMDDLSRLFYRELFRLDVRLESVFPGNVVFLNRKFANMLGTLRNVKHLEKISASLEKMGERHLLNYGALPEYFDTARQALLLALAQHLRADFTPELEAAWHGVFDEVAALMKQAMRRLDPGRIKPRQYNETFYDPGLLQAIGGSEVVRQVHQRFYQVMFDHPWLGQFFYGKPQDLLVDKQTKFMVAAFGGPNEYKGDTPAFVHMHMFITDEQADLRERILHRAILEQGLSEEIARRWLSIDHAFRAGIVKKSVDECVLKCFGQFPVTAKKPDNWRDDTL
jgi:truncated hemoglobin YjbI